MTPMMLADEVAHAFNATTERQYWKAAVAGTRVLPVVHFNSRASMVQIIYYPLNGTFGITFNRVSCAWGDFMASAHRSMIQVLQALKAAGMDVACPLDGEGRLRLEYDPAVKTTLVHMANHGDDWQDAAPLVFKVHENIENTIPQALDTI